MIFGIGTDIVNIKRIANLYTKNSTLFLKKILHEEELTIFSSIPPAKQASYLAKRFAAKEAFAKALGTGIGPNNLSFRDIIILNDAMGKPTLSLSSQHQEKLLNKQAHISLADEKEYAVAFVVISSA